MGPALDSAKYVMTIINDIMDLSSLNSKTLKLIPYKRSLVNTIKEAMKFIEPQAVSKFLMLDLKLPDLEWDMALSTDHGRLI